MNIIIRIIVLSLTAYVCQAGELRFETFNVENGLSHEVVRGAVQDEAGFLWVATEGGLNRYDGFNFTEFRYVSDDSPVSNVILDIALDSKGAIWLATLGSGVLRFDPETAEYTSVVPEELTSLQIAKLYVDSRDNIWVGTVESGLNLIERVEDSFIVRIFDKAQTGVSHPGVTAFTEDGFGRVWVGTDGGGIDIYQPATDSWQNINSKSGEAGLSENRIRSLFRDDRGDIWIGTASSGLNKYNFTNKTFEHYRHNPEVGNSLLNDKVMDIFQDRTGTMWFATDAGLSIFNGDYFENVTSSRLNPDSLSNNRVLSIYQDRGGLMWVGTYSGLNKWNPATRFFNHLIPVTDSGLEHTFVLDFSENSTGHIYMATYGGGIVVERDSGNWQSISKADGLPDNRVTCVMVDNSDGLWVGTRAHGIFYRASDEAEWINYKYEEGINSPLPSNGVSDIIQDRNGVIWIATFSGGITRFDGDDFVSVVKSQGEETGLSSKNVFQVMHDTEGYIWVASDSGINLVDPQDLSVKQFLPQSPNGTHKAATAWHIFEDRTGHFWIATQGGGVYFWAYEHRIKRLAEFEHLTVESGLPHDTVYGFEQDLAGNIWLSSARGLARINESDDEVTAFNVSHGIQGYDFNLGASYQDSNGMIYFGGTNGFNRFSAEGMTRNEHRPEVKLLSITSVDNRIQLPLQNKQLMLSHTDYFVAFDFVALDFAAPDKNQYQYQLEPFDKNWIHVGNLRRATYTNLPVGDYVFRVRAANNDGVWSDPQVNLDVVVIPAPWFTPAAFATYTLLAAMLLFWLIYNQIQKLARKDEQRRQLEKVVAQRTEELGKQNKALKVLNSKLEKVNVRDAQTGIHNRYFLDLYLTDVIAEINNGENSGKMMVLVIDIKNLFRIKDSWGQAAGDAVISHLAKLVATQIPEGAHLIRWGWNEFMVVGEVENHEQTLILVRKLVAEIDLDQFVWFETPINLSCVMGFAHYPFDEDNPEAISWDQVAMLADKALLSAKESTDVSWYGVMGTRREINELYVSELLHCQRITEAGQLVYFEKG